MSALELICFFLLAFSTVAPRFTVSFPKSNLHKSSLNEIGKFAPRRLKVINSLF